MSARPWYRRYGSDFIAGTLGLTLEEKGAYSLILDLIYDHGGPIADDPRYIAGVCGCSVRKWNAIRATLVKAGKIEVGDGTISNSRAIFELENDAKTARKLAENGRTGGNKRAENEAARKENNDLAEAGLKHRAPVQNPETREEANASSLGSGDKSPSPLSDGYASDLAVRERRLKGSYPPEFEALWSSYPTDRNMSKKAAFTVWRRFGKDKQAAALASCPAFKAYCAANPDYRPVHLARYLSQERFEGFLGSARGSPNVDENGNWLGPRHLRAMNGKPQQHQEPKDAPVLRGRAELHPHGEGDGRGGPEFRGGTWHRGMGGLGELFPEADWDVAVVREGGGRGPPH